MNYPPIGGYEHSEACDEGDPARMCSVCLIEADREWTISEGADQ